MFSKISPTAPDALYATAAACAADTRADKIDLSVGIYRDETGASPVMAVVKEAEAGLVRDQRTKAYRPLLGDPDYLRVMSDLVLGRDDELRAAGRVVAIQATGGTGALRLAAALIKSASASAAIHLGTPTWPSHAGVFSSEGLSVVEHSYWVAGAESPDWRAIETAAAATGENDVFLMHGACHNPTGIDLARDQRRAVLATLDRNGATPIMDTAYYGLGDGLEADLDLARDMLRSSRRAIVAVSCSKSFGLYRDRTGILFVACADAAEAQSVAGRLGSLSRLLVSSAPAHGAEVVARVLGNPESAAAWRAELDQMRGRIATLRAALASSGVAALRPIGAQKGIFAMLPLTPAHVAALACDHAIYMPPSGRANLVGLGDKDVQRFVEAIGAVAA